MLVPGCPPGLFTKQFAEFAPTHDERHDLLQARDGHGEPDSTPAACRRDRPPFAYRGTATDFFPQPRPTPVVPHTFPYLVDKFFYTGYGGPALGGAPPTRRWSAATRADGWFKMFEFFEVPSQMIGAIGPVAQGMNFDWARQDTKPGLINLNLIIDEEVFFSVFGKQDQSFNQQLLNFAQLPRSRPRPSRRVAGRLTGCARAACRWPRGHSPVPLVVTATNANGAPAAAYPMTNVGVVAPDPLTGGASATA